MERASTNLWWNLVPTGLRIWRFAEGDYLRNSEFGKLIQQLESAMPEYTDAEYKAICDAVWAEQSYETKHPTLFAELASFVQKASGLTLSYAVSHPWLSSAKDSETDTQQIR